MGVSAAAMPASARTAISPMHLRVQRDFFSVAGGLEECANAGGFLAAAAALLLRQREKKVLDEENNASGGLRKAQELRRLGLFGGVGQKAEIISPLSVFISMSRN